MFFNFDIASTTNFKESGKYVVPINQNHDSYNWLNGVDLNQGVELALLDLPIIGRSWQKHEDKLSKNKKP